MDEEKAHFIYGDQELGIPGCIANGISENTASEIWGKMEKFAEYAFNKSHAACYAALSMQTAYLKCHYPEYFYAGLISSVMDNPNKMPLYIQEAKRSGVKILPPDINTSGINFEVSNPNELSFGLGCIKGIGKETVNQIIEERNKKPFSGIVDFVRRTGFKKGVLEPMIKVGCFDMTGNNRQTMMANYPAVVKNETKEKASYVEGFSQMDFLSLMDVKDRFVPEKENKEENLVWERDLAGYYISGHPLESYSSKIVTNTAKIEDDSVKNKSSLLVMGVVTNYKKFFTKKNNRAMASFELEDLYGKVKALIFPDTYEELAQDRDFIKDGAIVLLAGYIQKKEDEDTTFIVQEISGTLVEFDEIPRFFYENKDLYVEQAGLTGKETVYIKKKTGDPLNIGGAKFVDADQFASRMASDFGGEIHYGHLIDLLAVKTESE